MYYMYMYYTFVSLDNYDTVHYFGTTVDGMYTMCR